MESVRFLIFSGLAIGPCGGLKYSELFKKKKKKIFEDKSVKILLVMFSPVVCLHCQTENVQRWFS